MGAFKEQFSVCQNLLRDNGGLAHNHFGGWTSYNDFLYKAISHLLEDGTIETRVTMFLDEMKKVPAYFIAHFPPEDGYVGEPVIIDRTPELTDLAKLMQISVDALVIQVTRLKKPGRGRTPKGGIALVMHKRAVWPKQRTNVREAGSARMNVLHDVFVELMIEKDMGINKHTGESKKKKKKKAS